MESAEEDESKKQALYVETMIGLEDMKRNWIVTFIKNKGF